jgi:hypothetical protein
MNWGLTNPVARINGTYKSLQCCTAQTNLRSFPRTHVREIRRQGVWIVALVFLAALSAGCTQKWYLTITNVVDARPEFCFSDTPWCGSRGHQLPFFQVNEVDDQGREIAVVWTIQGNSNSPQDYTLRKVRYGITPTGWREKRPAAPLREDVYYSTGEFYFVLVGNGKSRVYTREEFFKKIRGRTG